MKRGTRRENASERAGFTLLEILAVILIGALLLSFMVPNLSSLKSRAIRADADGIVAMVDLGRQRAVVTQTPHRMFIDIKRARYGLEWLAPIEEEDPYDERDASGLEIIAGTMLSLSPPPVVIREFYRLPGLMGRPKVLGIDVSFATIETEGGSVRSGAVYVDFYRDGTSSATIITLDNADGQTLQLEILPLADSVRIKHGEV
jgi:prepilin-type N-terminal cleavage/methylation domain-containing protein